jgi:glutathione synthase
MPNRHLFVMDPIDKINKLTDSTYDIMLECQSRSDEIWECQIGDLIVESGQGFAHARSVRIADGHFKVDERQKKSFSDFQFIWMRKDPPVDNNFIAALQMLKCTKSSKARVVNDPDGLLIANEKLWPLTVAADFMPKTVVSANPKTLFEATQRFKRSVVKPLFQSGGSGVMVFSADDKNLKSALDLLTNQGQNPAMLQQFIEGAETGDKRIILVGGKPVGAVLRVPGKDDHRANLHVGGTAFKTELSERELAICAHLEPLLLANGLHFVGIDVINGYLTEVNVTSPTGLQEIDRLNGHTGSARLRAKLMDYFLSPE